MGTDIIHPPNIPRKAERLCFTIWVSLPALSLGNSRLTSKPSRAHTIAAAVPDKNRSNQLIISNFRLTDSKILEMIHNGSVTKMLTIAFPSSISREEIGAERIIQKFFPGAGWISCEFPDFCLVYFSGSAQCIVIFYSLF